MCRFVGVLIVVGTAVLLRLVTGEGWATDVARPVPKPLVGHPGNIFLAGDEVTVPSQATATRWRAEDIDGNTIGEGAVVGGPERVALGELSVGWYRIAFFDAKGAPAGWTTAGVLARPTEPILDDSPVCVDSATAWPTWTPRI